MIDIKAILDKRRGTEKGWPVKMKVKYNNEHFMLSTGYYSHYDLVNGECNSLDDDAKVKNIMLAKMRSKLYSIALLEDEKEVSGREMLEALKEGLNGRSAKRRSKKCFLDYVEEFMSHIVNEGTRRTYQTMYNKIAEYDAKVRLEKIDYAWLQDFELAMKKRGYRTNYYGQIERSIRAVFNYCIDREYTERYPFRRFKTKSEKTIKRNLTAEQLVMLRDYACEPYQEIYRDMFMLMFYLMGINAVDLFTMPKIANLKAGDYIDYKRTKIGNKGGGLVKVKVEPEAMEIISRYAGTEHLLYVTERHCKNYHDFLHHMNIALQHIGPYKRVGRGGKKVYEPLFPGLTSYWARHSWATLAARLGVSMDVIGKALGHADSRMVDIYVEWDHESIDKANRKVLDALKG